MELVVCSAIFIIALGGVFMLFRKGYQAFHFLERRQSLQVEMLRIKSVLTADFDLSHYRSLAVTQKTGSYKGKDVRADDVSCLILNDWLDDRNYDDITRAPLWNQYAAYVSGKKDGTLHRLVLQDGTRLAVEPLSALEDYTVVGSRLLTENLARFEGDVNPDTRDLTLTLALGRGLGARGIDDKRVDEYYEGLFRFTPGNTQPKL